MCMPIYARVYNLLFVVLQPIGALVINQDRILLDKCIQCIHMNIRVYAHADTNRNTGQCVV